MHLRVTLLVEETEHVCTLVLLDNVLGMKTDGHKKKNTRNRYI